MGIYYAVVEGDPLSSGKGSRVFASHRDIRIEGSDGKERAMVFIGDPAYCCACESQGTVSYGVDLGFDARLEDWVNGGRLQAVGGDVVVCKCEKPPRIIAVNGLSWSIADRDQTVEQAAPASATATVSALGAVAAEAPSNAPGLPEMPSSPTMPAPVGGQTSGASHAGHVDLGPNVMKLVNQSPTARAQVKQLTEDGWDIEYGTKAPSFTDADNSRIYIDPAYRDSPELTMNQLSHELGHAESACQAIGRLYGTSERTGAGVSYNDHYGGWYDRTYGTNH